MGVVEKAERAAQRLRRPRCSKGLERSRPDVGRRVTRQLGNVWLCERWIARDEAGRAEANEVTGVREQRDEPIAEERSKPIELRSDPNRLASCRERLDQSVDGPFVTLAKPSQGRDRRDANVAVCTPDSLLEEPPGRAFAVDLRHERAGRVVRRAGRVGARIDSGVGAQPSDDDTGDEQQPTAARDRADHRQCRRIHRPSISAPRTGARSPFRGRPTRTGNVAAR